ncbi:MAG: PAS domain S-box protein [Candidatus Aminicenantes bacterium]
MAEKKGEDLQKIRWLQEKEDSQKKKDHQSYMPFYGDVTELNTERTILDLAGKDTLEMLCVDIMELLDTSVAVYEKNGDYALGMFVSGWCQLMDAASRKLCKTEDNKKALSCGKWFCHENCWHDSAKQAIKTGKPTDIECIGGINLYAEPIYAGKEIIGVINIGYGNPPTDEKTLKELSRKYQIDYNTLLTRAKEYQPRPRFIIDIAKKRLHNIAFLIGKIVQNAQNERKLQESEKKFKTITENSADAIFITDQKGNYVYVNRAVSDLLGYSKEEITQMNIRDISPPEEVRANARDFQRLLHGEKVLSELNLIKKDGSIVPVDLHAILLPNGFVYGSCRDITRRKKIEGDLHEKEILLTTVMENLPIGIAVNTVFPSVDFVYMNDKFPQTYGTTRKKLSKPGAFWDVVYEDPVFRSQLKKWAEDGIASGDPKRLCWENVPVASKGEETRYISACNIPIPGKNFFISTVMDVTDINQSQEKLRKAMNSTIEVISKVSERRDPYTSGHQHRVYQLSVAIARELRLPREKTEAVSIAALIHDIGKVAIPSEILTKAGKLSKNEFDLIKEHPQIGYDILKDVDFPYPIAQIVRQHHERMNGSGYPQGEKGEDILLEARIISVADTAEAMSSHRPYRPALGIDAALEEIQKNRDILYDPKVADACIELFREKGFEFE